MHLRRQVLSSFLGVLMCGLVVGCAVSDPPATEPEVKLDDRDTTTSPGNDSENNVEQPDIHEPVESQNNSTPANNSVANNDSPTEPDAPAMKNVYLRVVEQDWGLFDGFSEQTHSVELKYDDEGVYQAFWTWPPGVSEVTLHAEEQVFVIARDDVGALAVSQEQLQAESMKSESSQSESWRWLTFSAVDEPVQILTNLEQVTIQRVTLEEHQRFDDVSRATTVGHLFDQIVNWRSGDGDFDDFFEEVLKDFHRFGGGPFESSRGLLFVAVSHIANVEVRGSFIDDWQASARGALRRVSGALYGRYIDVPVAYGEYKIVYDDGSAWFTDRINRHINWDGINTHSIGDFNSVIYPELGDQNSGRTVWLRSFHSPELENWRDVYVHLPASYDALSAKDYPLLIVHDGNESIVRSQFHQVADQWALNTQDDGVVMAFVALPSQNVRMAEYTVSSEGARGDDYATFLVETLTPFLDAQFRLDSARASRALVGASLGGLISYWTAMHYPQNFGFVAGMSSTFWWDDDAAIQLMAERGCQDLSYYLDSGSPADNSVPTRAMRDLLESMDCQYVHIEQEGGTHDWSYWKARFPHVLDAFRATYAHIQ